MSAKGSSGASTRQSRQLPRFVHRFNPDGTVDSICTTCAKTVATEPEERALIPSEDRHECDCANRLKEPSKHSEHFCPKTKRGTIFMVPRVSAPCRRRSSESVSGRLTFGSPKRRKSRD